MNRTAPARRIALAGVLTALSVTLLYLLAVLPTLRLSVLFVLSLLPVAMAYEGYYADALLSFAAAATLSGLLFPAPDAWLLYAAFFGWYGIVREAAVTRARPLWAWGIRLLAFNASLAAVYLLSREVMLGFAPIPVLWLAPVAEAAFIGYELLFGLCRAYYLRYLRAHVIGGAGGR